MKDILSSTILAQAVFGLNDDAFMMFMVVFILLSWSICVGLAVVFLIVTWIQLRLLGPRRRKARA